MLKFIPKTLGILMETLGGRLTYLLRSNNMTQQQLADQIKVTKQTISQLCADKVYHSKAAFPIAKHFGVDLDWLLTGQDATGKIEAESAGLILNKFHKIPLFTTAKLDKASLVNGKLSFNFKTTEYELTSDPEYPFLFAMVSSNNAIKFRFGGSATLIFHTELQPHDGDFVIVYLPDKDLFVYRDLRIEGQKKYLEPLDSDLYKSLDLKPEDLIVAVLYEKRIKREINTLSFKER